MLENNIIYPLPEDRFLMKLEKYWRVSLPEDYKKFLLKNNGLVPNKNTFDLDEKKYLVERFLCVLENTKNNLLGMYDINVVISQLDERLFFHEDVLGVELVPIAALFSGNFVCLDYKDSRDNPSVCVWNHEESYELEPAIEFVADSFTDFLAMLHE